MRSAAAKPRQLFSESVSRVHNCVTSFQKIEAQWEYKSSAVPGVQVTAAARMQPSQHLAGEGGTAHSCYYERCFISLLCCMCDNGAGHVLPPLCTPPMGSRSLCLWVCAPKFANMYTIILNDQNFTQMKLSPSMNTPVQTFNEHSIVFLCNKTWHKHVLLKTKLLSSLSTKHIPWRQLKFHRSTKRVLPLPLLPQRTFIPTSSPLPITTLCFFRYSFLSTFNLHSSSLVNLQHITE